jgi:CubicO group peptidase (beta-lactamase class C family)
VRTIDGLHGAAIVSREGSVVLEAAGGLADAQSGAPCMPSTRFQIASVSKLFAAVAAMLLVDSGALSVSDPVERWLPEMAKEWRPITLHQLLCHTAGIPHWHDAPGFDPTQKIDAHQR